MKISNLKKIKVMGCVMIALSILPIIGFFISENTIWKLGCLLFFIAIVLIIINLRGIEVENSGECFSLKERHPFVEKKYVPSKIELPISLINELDIQEGIFTNQMNIKIRSNHSVKKIRIRLPLFTRHQILKIKKTFREKDGGELMLY